MFCETEGVDGVHGADDLQRRAIIFVTYYDTFIPFCGFPADSFYFILLCIHVR